MMSCQLAPCSHWNGQMCRLRCRSDISRASSASFQGKGSRPGFSSIGRNSYDRNFELIVREYKMVAECAVRLKLDGPAVDRNLCLRMGASIENDFRIDVHKELSFHSKRLSAPTRSNATEQAA